MWCERGGAGEGSESDVCFMGQSDDEEEEEGEEEEAGYVRDRCQTAP